VDIIFHNQPASSQELFRSFTIPVRDSLNYSSLSFDHELNTYVWTGDFKKEIYEQNWSLTVQQRIRSRLIKTDETAVQDEYQGLINVRARLGDELNYEIKNSSNVLADNRAADLGRTSQHQFLTGVEYMPSGSLRGEVLGGYELNAQEEENDHGFAYALGLDAHQIKLEEFDASLQSSWNQSFLGRRSPQTGVIGLALLRDFGSGINDSLAVNYSTQHRQFYTSIDPTSQQSLGVSHNIFQRNASVLEITNQTRYYLDRDFSLLVSFGISNQLIDRGYRYKDYLHPASLILDSHIQEMQFFGIVSLQWTLLDWLRTDIKLSYSEKEERHSVLDDMEASNAVIDTQRAMASRLENTAQRTTLTAALNVDASQDDKIHVVSSAGILRYDTPDILNTDDRDELLLTSGLDYVHRFSSRMVLTLNADLTFFHLVYLNRDKSANNNWNRVLRFSPGVDYTPVPWFRTVMRTEVLANYTVSDYEEQVASIQSFSFRQVLWVDSTAIQLSKRIQCKFSGSLRIFEHGTLHWQEFKERPEEYAVEKSVWPEIVWSSLEGFNIGIGYRYFGQDRYTYQGSQRIFSQGIEAMGPTASLEWSGAGGAKVVINGWREEQKNNGTTTTILSNLSIQIGFIL
jgi:hypothetical protein